MKEKAVSYFIPRQHYSVNYEDTKPLFLFIYPQG